MCIRDRSRRRFGTKALCCPGTPELKYQASTSADTGRIPRQKGCPQIEGEDFFLLFTEDGRCESDIRTRLGMAKSVLTELLHIWNSRTITRCIKLRLLRILVCPVGLMELSHGPLASGNSRNCRVSRQSATGKLCEYHEQP